MLVLEYFQNAQLEMSRATGAHPLEANNLCSLLKKTEVQAMLRASDSCDRPIQSAAGVLSCMCGATGNIYDSDLGAEVLEKLSVFWLKWQTFGSASHELSEVCKNLKGPLLTHGNNVLEMKMTGEQFVEKMSPLVSELGIEQANGKKGLSLESGQKFIQAKITPRSIAGLPDVVCGGGLEHE